MLAVIEGLALLQIASYGAMHILHLGTLLEMSLFPLVSPTPSEMQPQPHLLSCVSVSWC